MRKVARRGAACSLALFLGGRRSVEWLNSFVKVVWPLINPDMFVSIIDMVEDVMQASLPGFVDAVKVSFLSYLQLRLGRSR